MLKVENYPYAFKEVCEILKNMNREDVEKIPNSYINMIKNNMDDNYEFILDNNTEFEKQELLKETKVILADIYLNYWADDEQKIRIKQKFKYDIMREEEKKIKNIYTDEFSNKNQKLDSEEKTRNEINSDIQMVECKKENIFTKFLNKIKKIFSKNKSQRKI